ncbi:MAG: hypothetical protein KAQ83_01755 [Nanoarchaeota archaeon]|nr:hypothetical protein [Nanoarchaeota archaeon]
MNKQRILDAIAKAGKALYMALPVMFGVVILVSISKVFIPSTVYASVFQNNLLDSFIGSSLGSILAGNPITSYIIGGELLNNGISLIAVTAFMVSWVTVGLIQLPAESVMLGKKFAIYRNISSFVLSIFVAILTVFIVGVIS